MQQIKIIRKHILQPKSMHLALDSLQRTINKNLVNGWIPIGSLFQFNDFIIVMVANDLNDAIWEDN